MHPFIVILKKKISDILLLVFFLVSNLSYSDAQTHIFAQLTGAPVNTSGWNFSGDATVANVSSPDNSEILLCHASNSQSGAVFYSQPINLAFCNDWTAEFDFRIFDGSVADGIAFCFLDVPPTGFVVGAGLGIPATAQGLKICFDTYPNCGSGTMPKIEIRYGAGYSECWAQPTVDNSSNTLSFIRSANYNHVRITYNSGNINVYVNGTLYLTGFQTFNFAGYLGFTAGTGALNDNHSIKNVFIYTYLPPSEAGVSQVVCSGGSVEIGSSPAVGNTYDWTPSTGLSAANIANPIVSLTNNSNSAVTQKYYVNTSLSSSPGCVSVDSVEIVVNPTPSLNISASANNICQGSPVTFTALATNGGTLPVYQWKKNNIKVGINATTYTDNALSNGDVISCTLINTDCVSINPVITSSNSITMMILSTVTPSINISASANNVCSGSAVTFTATVTDGGTTPVYQWKLNGINVGTNSSSYTSSSLVNGDVVSCVLTSNAGCVSNANAVSNDITMIIVSTLTPTITISTSANNVCSGSAVTFAAITINGGTTPIYQWKLNGINVGTNSSSYTSSTLVNGDVVSCILTSSANCVSNTNAVSNNITMVIAPNLSPAINITASANNVCSGSVVTFTTTVNNAGAAPVYQWKLNGINFGTNSSSYTSSSLVNGDVISCTVTSNATCVSNANAVSNSITMAIAPNLTPTINITASANNTCSGSPVTFTAMTTNGGSTAAYQWKLNGLNAGTNSNSFTSSTLINGDIVSCVLTSSSSCVSSANVVSNNITIAIMPTLIPSITISASVNNVCSGSAITFTGTATNGGPAPVYHWKLNDVNVGINSNSYTATSLVNGDIITCTLTSSANCTANVTAVSNAIIVVIRLKKNTTINIGICPGQNYAGYTTSGTYTDTYTGSNGCDSTRVLNLTVYPKRDTVIHATICSGMNFEGYTSSGVYQDLFRSIHGCDSTRKLILKVLPLAAPYLGKDTSICLGESITLSPGVFATYQWQDGSVKNQFVVKQPGTYSVKVTNTCGSASDAIIITNKDCNFYFPSAFSPNRDGVNDIFKILTPYTLKEYHLSIYNRWGQKIFESLDYLKGWNGTNNGENAENGGYVWHCELTNPASGNKISRNGTVLLVR